MCVLGSGSSLLCRGVCLWFFFFVGLRVVVPLLLLSDHLGVPVFFFFWGTRVGFRHNVEVTNWVSLVFFLFGAPAWGFATTLKWRTGCPLCLFFWGTRVGFRHKFEVTNWVSLVSFFFFGGPRVWFPHHFEVTNWASLASFFFASPSWGSATPFH